MIEINALLCVRNFGHTPVLVIDDVNSSNFEKSNYEEEIEDIVREVAKIFFHQQQMKFSGLSHFELPGKNPKASINNLIKFNIFFNFYCQFVKKPKKYFEFSELKLCRLSQFESLSDEDAEGVANHMGWENNWENKNAIKMGKLISELNLNFNTKIGFVSKKYQQFNRK